MPAPGDSKWAVLRRRVAIMAYVLLAPEFVIGWAARQHFAARYWTKMYSRNHPDWTRTHSFFVVMGGFTLHKRGKPVHVLQAKELKRLSEAGEIEWPTVTKAEIEDRSKGDYLSKTIVLFQATWFIAQCITRAAYGLTVTELELVTVAFAMLTGVIYYLWWDKPLDVRCSIPVHLLDGRLRKREGEVSRQGSGQRQGSDHRQGSGQRQGSGPQIPPLKTISSQELPGSDENMVASPTTASTIQFNISIPDPPLSRMERFEAFRRRSCMKHGTLFGLAYVFIAFPLKRFFAAFEDMITCTTLEDKTLRVPTFYSANNDDDDDDLIPLALAGSVSIVFGAIHCVAWSFHFPTVHEQWVWRISSILISGLPISIAALLLLSYLLYLIEIDIGGIGGPIFIAECCLYIIARIILLILPLTTLRALPTGAYVQLNWISFLPHM